MIHWIKLDTFNMQNKNLLEYILSKQTLENKAKYIFFCTKVMELFKLQIREEYVDVSFIESCLGKKENDDYTEFYQQQLEEFKAKQKKKIAQRFAFYLIVVIALLGAAYLIYYISQEYLDKEN